MKFGHIFELRDKDLNIALLFSCILSLSCILCFSVAIDLHHKLESYSPTSEKIIRIIFKKPFVAHTDLACERQTFPTFKSLQILKLSVIYFFQAGKFMYSYKIGLLLNVFEEMFLMTTQVHSYNTRNSNTFDLFRARTNIRLFGIIFQGPKFLNSLNNNHTINTATISLFKSRLKTFLLSWLTICK